METQPEETRTCSNSKHPMSGNSTVSPYPKDKVPKSLFYKTPNDTNSKILKTCFHCRERKVKNNLTMKTKRRDLASKSIGNALQYCLSDCHTRKISIYEKDKVPASHFRKDASDPKSEIYKFCCDCRKYYNDKRNEVITTLKNKKLENENFICCPSQKHDKASHYPREEVPKEMFRKYPEDSRSPLFDNCSDCRNHSNRLNTESKKKRIESIDTDSFFCNGCNQPHFNTNRATNLDGSISASCISCKSRNLNNKHETKNILKMVKLEFIYKNECSCQKCKNVYLKSENRLSVVEIPTYEKDGVRYIKYQNVEYISREFLAKFEEFLELRVLEFDHLSEKEQRDRGLLKENDVYVPKKSSVCDLMSEDSIRLESLKTEVICSRCHVEETIRRKISNKPLNIASQEKMDYVNNLKRKGCSCCGFYDTNLHRFLEFDHLDPHEKIDCISKMVKSNDYNLQDVISETDEKITRILCRFCHALHTSFQIQEGII